MKKLIRKISLPTFAAVAVGCTLNLQASSKATGWEGVDFTEEKLGELESNQVTSLQFNFSRFNVQDFRRFLKGLQDATNLTELSTGNLHPDQIEGLCEVLKRNEELKKLHLGNICFANPPQIDYQNGISLLSEMLKTNLTLKVLDLSAWRFGLETDAIELLSEMIKKPGLALEEIDLPHTSIEGIIMLSKALKSNEFLKIIRLSEIKVKIDKIEIIPTLDKRIKICPFTVCEE